MNWTLLQNSLLVSGLATVLAMGLGLAAALCLAGLPRPWRKILLALAVLALAFPPFLVTNCWLQLFGAGGVLRSWLPLNIFSLGGGVWILSLLLWPITLWMVWGAWQNLDPAQLESDLAVSGSALLRGLLLPLARTALLQSAVLTFVLSLNNFAVPAILQVKVFPAEMWIEFNTTFDTVGALKISWPLVAVPLFLLLWLRRTKLAWPQIQSPVSPGLFRRQLGGIWFGSCIGVTLLLCVLAVGVPALQLLLVKRTWTELPGALAAGQTAVWYSFFFAASAAVIVTTVALVVEAMKAGARSVCRPRSRWPVASVPAFLGWLAWLTFLVPGILIGIGLIALFNHAWSAAFYQGAGIVVLAFVIRYLAPGWTAISHALGAVDRELVDAARLEGAGAWQMLRRVHWPQIAPQVAAAWYIIFLLCLWDIESMILVVPPGGETLALRIFNLLHYGHNSQVNALCVALLGLAVAPLLAWQVWTALRRRRVAAFFTFLGVLFLAGCSPGSRPSETVLQSSLFSGVRLIGSRGVGVGELNKPRSVAVDKQDNLYVVDMTGRVQKFSPDGVFLLSWQMPQTDLGRPKGMGRDLEGDIIVVEPHYQRLNYFSTQGKLLAQWGQKGTNAGQLIMPRAVAENSRGETFVSEYGEVERVQKFRLGVSSGGSPTFIGSIGQPGTAPGQFNRPEGICVDAHDRLYVADSCNHRIQVFSSDGKFLRAYGRAGKGKGELSYPYDICVDSAGRQYVCEFGNSRIQVFDANAQPLEIIGGPGAEPGNFNNPWGVALDSAGNLYVADSQNHRVQKLLRRPSTASRDFGPRPSAFGIALP